MVDPTQSPLKSAWIVLQGVGALVLIAALVIIAARGLMKLWEVLG